MAQTYTIEVDRVIVTETQPDGGKVVLDIACHADPKVLREWTKAKYPKAVKKPADEHPRIRLQGRIGGWQD